MARCVQHDDSRVAHVTSATLLEVLGRRCDHAVDVVDLMSPTPAHVLFGRAVTMRFVPRRSDMFDRERHDLMRLFLETVGVAGKVQDGSVLVMSTSGNSQLDLGGRTNLLRLRQYGLMGLVTDGRLRDLDGLRRCNIAAWCTGDYSSPDDVAVMPLVANVAVSFMRVTVIPGDYIYADRSAVIVIPAEEVEWALDEALRIEADARRGGSKGVPGNGRRKY